ncbi:hypothetical protein PRLR5067_01330 [Prevotella lacticifex]|uniref:Eco57I restriction-modification methylase domain-containing protein n=1 Tax=Prevotella lacticifex TaxID=2854755 RepID=UPI001CC7D52F|nr:Eco57I restriction-modification methylase domain-containing protein [Prevotella lacticifex]GJG44537.1 hypothetical protein PRLR5027_01320 [Prevotella lacticifex]GJG54097.1 hypothetical protein PRLR5067_01330 [Prevotella lacticifex]
MDILSDCRKLDELLLDPAKSLKERSQINVPFFDWHIMFNDVFNRPNGANGFDIVIGNPPYVQLQSNEGALAKMYEDAQFASFTRTGDIYCLFYERGWQLLKNGGHLCYITSNKWMRAGYGEKLRKFIANSTNPKMLIDFAGLKIFESATVDTNILLFEKGKNKRNTICVNANKDYRNCLHNLSNFVQQQHTVNAFTSSDSWVILSPIEQSIKQKIEAVGVPLKDWDIQINYGIKTGCNEAFIINTEKRNEILDNCKDEAERKRTEELIRPILRGRDIKRYGYNWAGLWLINTHNGIKGKVPPVDINNYPAIKAHLDKYWSKISKRADKGDTPYNLRNCAYMEDFDKPKITWGNLNLKGSYSFAPEGMFINAPCPFIATNNTAILHILNSKIADYYIRSLGVTRNGGYFEYKPMFVDKIPIPRTNLEKLKTYPFQPNQQEEKELTALIYKLYNLSKQEIDYLENREH